ncbi:hypothetical protein L3X38_038060 [Prunus dulcis]|uniref:Uncharacterized protein n=1 Tax=Prunus dulcis TaxID=3755 RepID=A0AAD4YQ48_PRUDU|nr:hypothetical protein L3X38_038060 [Prunus dulcis]
MDTLDQLRNRRRMGPEAQLRSIGVRKVSSSTSARQKKESWTPWIIEKPKVHGSGRTPHGVWGSARSVQMQTPKIYIMATMEQLRKRRRMGPEGQLRGIGVRKLRGIGCKVSSNASTKTKPKSHGHLGLVEKSKVHGFRSTSQGYWGPQGQLKCKRKEKKKGYGHLGSVQKLNENGSGRITQGIGVRKGSSGLLGSARSAQEQAGKKKVMDTLDQLRNRKRMGPEAQLKDIGVRKLRVLRSARSVQALKKIIIMATLDQLRNRRRMGSEGQPKGYWDPQRYFKRKRQKQNKKYHGHLGSVEKQKAHGSGRIA